MSIARLSELLGGSPKNRRRASTHNGMEGMCAVAQETRRMTPHYSLAVWHLILSAWPTRARLHVASVEEGVFGCGGCPDSRGHYSVCELLWPPLLYSFRLSGDHVWRLRSASLPAGRCHHPDDVRRLQSVSRCAPTAEEAAHSDARVSARACTQCENAHVSDERPDSFPAAMRTLVGRGRRHPKVHQALAIGRAPGSHLRRRHS